MTGRNRKDAYQMVTDLVLEALDKGVVPWRRPWQGGFETPRSLSTGKEYRGINTFLLSYTAYGSGYTSPWWGTYNQIKKQGGQIRKGEHGSFIVFYRIIEKKNEDDEDERFFFLRYYKVFNVEQADWPEGLPAKCEPEEQGEPTVAVDATEKMINDYIDHPVIHREGVRAFYRPSTDQVYIPETEAFESGEAEFATLAHELVHSTGHEKRLARLDLSSFGREPYAKEELVAEMGAAFLAAIYGVTSDNRIEQTASYIDGWRKAISEDKKLVVHAASKAQAAAEYIYGVTADETEEEEEAEMVAA